MKFIPERHNQVYCCPEHCRLETNNRIRKNYHDRKARLSGTARVCRTPGCSTLLSRYNTGKVCGKCEAEQRKAEEDKVMRMLGVK